ncbi:MAG TPA: acetolactate decarboxylase [Solirubrobacterales bacterium]|nr:acetolactate decarboxylase [Solirubrobacterales bacterium]
MLDERWIKSLHVETMREAELQAERAAHVLFQASTIGALLEGAYDGDLSFAELAEHGDLGLGTLNGLDGEMIALDGRFYRADVEGRVAEVPPEERTPFAVVIRLAPSVDVEIAGAGDHEELLGKLDELMPPGAASAAIRIDGRFELVRARSVPRQSPPYRPLTEVVAEQHVFELSNVEGTMLGFRFPDYVEGIEVSGYHLHFVSADRSRGGHVLGSRAGGPLRVRIDASSELHVELPPGVELADPEVAAETHAAVELVERSS